MQIKTVRDRNIWVITLWVPLIIYYIVGVSGLLYEPIYEYSLEMINSGIKRNPSESAWIEHLEAFFWFLAFVFYLSIIFINRSKTRSCFWYMFFCGVCFIAFGEEISWGQHFFNFTPPDKFLEINTQGELNCHNLHLAKSLGISPENPLYPYMGSLTVYLNPLFYMLCILIWLVIPLMLPFFENSHFFHLFRTYPFQDGFFYVSFAFFIGIYLLVDNFIFDAGELFELTLATAGCMTATMHLDIGRKKSSVLNNARG